MKRKLLIILVIMGLLVFGNALAAANTPDDVLVVANNFDASSLDPAVAYEFTSCFTIMNVYDTLVKIEDGEAVPRMAKSWDVSEDKLTWTFNIRENMKFASGNDIDAEAVKFSLNRSMEMGKGPSWMLNEVMTPENIEVLDKYTIQFKLKKPTSYFLSVLYNTCASIVDPEVVKSHEKDDDWGENWLNSHSGDAASGPYKLVNWEQGDSITLERNENYWGEKPKFKKVIIRNIKESVTQKMQVQNEDADIAFDITPDQVKDLKNNEDVEVINGEDLRAYYLGMNVEKEPLDNQKVRMAIKHAINYEQIIEDLANGYGNTLEGAIVKPLIGYQGNMGVYEYNPSKAKELLEESGYPDGFEIELTAISSSMWEEIITKVDNDLEEVGISVNIRQMNSAGFYELFREGKLELMLSGWGSDYPDPHNFAHPFGHSEGSLTQRVNYKNEEIDKMIEEAAKINDTDERKDIYGKMERELANKGPWAMLYQPQQLVVIRDNLKGYEYDPSNIFNFRKAYK